MICEKCKKEHGRRVQFKSKEGLKICLKCFREENSLNNQENIIGGELIQKIKK